MEDNIKRVIRAILIEFQEREIPLPTLRAIHPPWDVPGHNPSVKKAWVLMGMRRSGKTWAAYQHIHLRQKQGFAKDTNLYINFEDDRLQPMTAQDLGDLLEGFYTVYPQNHDKPCYLFLDEIQAAPHCCFEINASAALRTCLSLGYVTVRIASS